jgi:hypothetical protein
MSHGVSLSDYEVGLHYRASLRFGLDPCPHQPEGVRGQMVNQKTTADHIAEMKLVRAHVDAPKVDPEVARYKRELESILADWSPASRRHDRVGGHDEVKAIDGEQIRIEQ